MKIKNKNRLKCFIVFYCFIVIFGYLTGFSSFGAESSEWINSEPSKNLPAYSHKDYNNYNVYSNGCIEQIKGELVNDSYNPKNILQKWTVKLRNTANSTYVSNGNRNFKISIELGDGQIPFDKVPLKDNVTLQSETNRNINYYKKVGINDNIINVSISDNAYADGAVKGGEEFTLTFTAQANNPEIENLSIKVGADAYYNSYYSAYPTKDETMTDSERTAEVENPKTDIVVNTVWDEMFPRQYFVKAYRNNEEIEGSTKLVDSDKNFKLILNTDKFDEFLNRIDYGIAVKKETGMKSLIKRSDKNDMPYNWTVKNSNSNNDKSSNEQYRNDSDGEYPSDYTESESGMIRNYQSAVDYPEAYLSKTASEVKKADGEVVPGEFNIDLNIEGKSIKTQESMDIVVVLDNSNSMNNSSYARDTRAYKARVAVEKFINDMFDNSSDSLKIKMGLVTYGTSIVENYSQELTDDKNRFSGKILPLDYDINSNKVRTSGGTFTQKAIEKAKTYLDKGSGSKKIMVVVTDGIPSFSYKINRLKSGDSSIIYDGLDYNTYLEGLIAESFNRNSVLGGGLAYGLGRDSYSVTADNGESYYIGDNGFATVSSAKMIQKKGVEIYSIGILSDYDNNDVDKTRANWVLNNLSSSKKNFYNVNDDGIADAIKQIGERIYKTVDNGYIVDPIGENLKMKILNGDFRQASDENLTDGDYYIEDNKDGKVRKNVKVEFKDGKLKIYGISLGEGEKLRIRYRVNLLTDNVREDKDGKKFNDFKADFFYQANGRTYLVPKENTASENDKLDFIVPSVKGEGININKVWPDKDKNAHESIVVRLKDKKGELEDELIRLDNGNEFKTQLNNYSLVDNNGNYMNKDNFRFEITEESINGSKGMAKMYSPILEFNKNNITIQNRFIGKKIRILKTDDMGVPVVNDSSAEFEFYSKNDNEKVFDEKGNEVDRLEKIKLDAKGNFTIPYQAPGEYYIEEKKAPKGYVLPDGKVLLKIEQKGFNEITKEPEFSTTAEIENIDTKTIDNDNKFIGAEVLKNGTDEDTVYLKITNRVKPELPMTGKSGEHIFYMVGFIFIFLSFLSIKIFSGEKI